MSKKSPDLHGNAPDNSTVALLLMDVINDLEFKGGEELAQYALPAAKKIATLKQRAKLAGMLPTSLMTKPVVDQSANCSGRSLTTILF